MLNDYSGTMWMGTPWKKLQVKVCVVKCKTSIQTQTSSTIMTQTVGFLPYNLSRANNSSLWFCLSPTVSIISIKWCSLSFMKCVNRWTIIHGTGHNQSLLSYYTLDQQEPECKTVSCLAVWHRLVNHHTVTHGSANYHCTKSYISSAPPDTTSTSECLDLHLLSKAAMGCLYKLILKFHFLHCVNFKCPDVPWHLIQFYTKYGSCQGYICFKESLPFHGAKNRTWQYFDSAAVAAEIVGAVVKLVGRFWKVWLALHIHLVPRYHWNVETLLAWCLFL